MPPTAEFCKNCTPKNSLHPEPGRQQQPPSRKIPERQKKHITRDDRSKKPPKVIIWYGTIAEVRALLMFNLTGA